ncbi:5-oxoprolinase subunit PxpB [Tabrizicola sp.]|uniref:5-oxoprolinase subunit PxpB n=1 Tax=Tabrizicola sp. TaxID=2005166 RepID=UPI0027338B28|nr:5-oxoprolinase subunit PxpB [Tabrizicola sp.]MDP3197199.1 5-oxoprolinase subunit PxpB [Tabrizicola sp.]
MRIGAVRSLADTAVTLEMATSVGLEASAKVSAALGAIEQAMASGALPGVSEVAAAFCSVTVHYDCLQITQSDLADRLTGLLGKVAPTERPEGRSWLLPCCYHPELGLDLASLSEALSLDPDRIVALHQATTFHVYALGFLPGLPFLGDLPPDLARPRRTEPRLRVPAGSVAIANRMCVIYPWNSPGGWHIVGRCPVPLFDITCDVPALLAAGDSIRFKPITREEFRDLDRDLRASGGSRDAFRVAC